MDFQNRSGNVFKLMFYYTRQQLIMSRNSYIPTMRDEQEIQFEYQSKISRFDLFDSLIKAVDQEAHAHPHFKVQQIQLQAAADQYQMQEQSNEHHRGHHGCKCSKIGCLKLYCECFANGRKCGGGCSCTCCHNKPGNQKQIHEAKMLANLRHPGYFKGVPALTPTRKCTCKRSMCQKRYCECFNAGLKCTEFCECKECQNGHPHSHQEQQYQNAEQQMMEIEVQA